MDDKRGKKEKCVARDIPSVVRPYCVFAELVSETVFEIRQLLAEIFN